MEEHVNDASDAFSSRSSATSSDFSSTPPSSPTDLSQFLDHALALLCPRGDMSTLTPAASGSAGAHRQTPAPPQQHRPVVTDDYESEYRFWNALT